MLTRCRVSAPHRTATLRAVMVLVIWRPGRRRSRRLPPGGPDRAGSWTALAVVAVAPWRPLGERTGRVKRSNQDPHDGKGPDHPLATQSIQPQANEAQRNRGANRAERHVLQRQPPPSQRGRVQLAATSRRRSSETRIDPRLYDLLNLRKERLHHRIVVLRAEFTMRLGGGVNLLRRQV